MKPDGWTSHNVKYKLETENGNDEACLNWSKLKEVLQFRSTVIQKEAIILRGNKQVSKSRILPKHPSLAVGGDSRSISCRTAYQQF